jgi:predicted RNA-binding protein YlxR (DUF448 family)
LRIALGGARDRDGVAVPDPGQRMPGRGAYLCRAAEAGVPAPACLRRALERGGISRTLRCNATMTLVESVGR